MSVIAQFSCSLSVFCYDSILHKKVVSHYLFRVCYAFVTTSYQNRCELNKIWQKW